MANTNSCSNGEPSKKETRVNFEPGTSGIESDQVEVTIHNSSRSNGLRNRKPSYHFLPKPFERSNGSLMNPKFDSKVLENHLVKCYFPQVRRLFRHTLLYVAIASCCWALFFIIDGVLNDSKSKHWVFFMIGSIISLIAMIALILFTRSPNYERHPRMVALFLAIFLIIVIQLPFIFKDAAISSVGTFFGVVEILILLYSFFPITLFAAAGLGGFLSISYEILIALRNEKMQSAEYIICKLLLHFIIHFIGCFMYIMTNTRMRSNFSKICQSVSAQEELKRERETKEKMIHSLMPQHVANMVMATHPSKDEADADDEADEAEKKKRKRGKSEKGEIIFRKFQMDEMKNVSILFADIVGFTKMSSNKTAERLVSQLNDLFGRFDLLCNESGCEKISTLGDCYYCVSGCPNPRPDHAICCVEMGLSMVIAIKAFDEDHNEEVNMRVGVHTGTVLCGIVGTVRFKFDVWSNDVTLANTMESTGEPGKVHISESTREFCLDEYEMEEGEEVPDNRGKKELIEHYDAAQSSFTIKHREETRNIKTYFITGRKPGKTGIPGLMEMADRRPKEFQKKAHGGGDTAADTENGKSASATAELFAPPVPDPMSEDNELDNKGEEDPEQGADSTLLKHGAHEGGAARGSMTTTQDIELIEILKKKEVANKELFQPKLNKMSLTFEPEQEHEYRHEFINSHLFQENMLSSPRYQTLIESNLALTAMVVLAICCHVMVGGARTLALTVVTIVGITFEILVVIDALTNILCLEAKKARFPMWMTITMNWYFRNILGLIQATIPTALVLSSVSCDLDVSHVSRDIFFCFAIVVALLHYCNHTMLRSYAKTVVAVVAGTVFIVLLFVKLCTFDDDDVTPSSSPNSSALTYSAVSINSSTSSPILPPADDLDHLFTGEHGLRFEIILSVLLLFVLITLLNYEFENSYRLSFYASVKAQRDKENMQLNKDQAEWLLHNIIPAHLAELFKNNQGYSRNHQDVGVIFATITNFNEFYDEMYAGGREYLRVLNELVSDYEVMLSETRFKDVEKIKTISSSFMAAAGLNEESRAMNKHKYAHLFALMEFAMELQQVVERFNDSIFNFSFVLNIGYNFGPVTAGVIGTTKLLYDIWGDTVNIASRMYSTGEPDRIQVPQATAEALGEMFEFSYRDEIAVKGKGNMKTYLLERKKDGAHWE